MTTQKNIELLVRNQVMWNLTSKSLDSFLSTLQVNLKPSNLAKIL